MGAWPNLDYEDRTWVSTIDPGHLSVYERQRISRPYQAPEVLTAMDDFARRAGRRR